MGQSSTHCTSQIISGVEPSFLTIFSIILHGGLLLLQNKGYRSIATWVCFFAPFFVNGGYAAHFHCSGILQAMLDALYICESCFEKLSLQVFRIRGYNPSPPGVLFIFNFSD